MLVSRAVSSDPHIDPIAEWSELVAVKRAALASLAVLTQRELEVLHFLAMGGSNKDIARSLAISPRTVEIHRGHMLLKLGEVPCARAVHIYFSATLPVTLPEHLD
jgi:DNA-binding CsgD family transcriptional regulator